MPSNPKDELSENELIIRVLKRTMDDLLEAYFRTPPHISSKTYIERALRRVQYTYSYLTHNEYNKNLREPKYNIRKE